MRLVNIIKKNNLYGCGILRVSGMDTIHDCSEDHNPIVERIDLPDTLENIRARYSNSQGNTPDEYNGYVFLAAQCVDTGDIYVYPKGGWNS